jgi:hypothetical protein
MNTKLKNRLCRLLVGAGVVICMTVIMGCQFPGSNQPPYPVTGDNENPFVAEETNPSYQIRNVPQEYFLFIKQINGQDDPDPGDIVKFAADNLPTYMSLDEDTGVVTFVNAEGTGVTVRFWSVDEHGANTKDESFLVNFIWTTS